MRFWHKCQYAVFAYFKIASKGGGAVYRLRDLREDRDLSQEKVAEYLHISQATYSRYESGKLDIPSAALIALAKYYSVSVDYLLGVTKEDKPYG